MKESVQLFLIVASAFGALFIFIAGLTTYNILSSEGVEEPKDSTAVRQNFKAQQAPSVMEEPAFIMPERYPRLKDIEEDTIEKLLKQLKKKGPSAELLKDLRKHLSIDLWQNLPDNFLLSDSWFSDSTWVPMIMLADEVKHEDLLCSNVEKLKKLVPYILDSRRCPVTPENPTAIEAFKTMTWALRAQQLLSRFSNETTIDTSSFEIIEKLAESLKSCAVKWEKVHDVETAVYVVNWITTPLTQKLYNMAVRPVEMLYHRGYEPKYVSPTVRKGEFSENSDGKLITLFSYWDEPRRVALSFLKRCEADDKDAPASCYCYQGPVFYKKAISLILSLYEKILVDNAKKDGKSLKGLVIKDKQFTWWEQHLLMTLPYEVVGPWAEDYVIAALVWLSATEAFLWCHWSRKVDNSRVYDLVSRNKKMGAKYDTQDIPQRPVIFPIDATSSESLTQITNFGKQEETCHTKRLVSKEKLAALKEIHNNSSKIKLSKKAGKDATTFKVNPDLLLSDSKEYFEEVLYCFEEVVTSPETFHLKNLKVSYAGEAASDNKGLFREFINSFLESLVKEEKFSAFEIKNESGIELNGTINPNIMRLLAHVFGKTLQNESRPSVYFSKELNALLGSEYPPTKEQCLEYARKNFDLLKTKKKGRKPWEPNMIKLQVLPRYKRTMIAVDNSERIFQCGKTEMISKEKLNAHKQRIEIFGEWYIKKCRQTFADTFYKYLTVGGRSYYHEKWLDLVLRPLPEDIGSLANTFELLDECKRMGSLKDKDGKEYTYEEAFVKAITTINMYKETLYWIYNSSAAPPVGFEKGFFTVKCANERGANDSPKLPFCSTCSKQATLYQYKTLEEMTNALRTSILHASTSLYEEPEGTVRYADDPSKSFTADELIDKSTKEFNDTNFSNRTERV